MTIGVVLSVFINLDTEEAVDFIVSCVSQEGIDSILEGGEELTEEEKVAFLEALQEERDDKEKERADA